MNSTRKLTIMAVLVAIGTILAVWFPARILMAYPVQHTVNVIAAVLLGPGRATAVAFMISLLRTMLGASSLLAFPGAMFGAFLAGYFYKKFKWHGWAVLGEIIGTGLIAALVAVPFAKYVMGITYGAFFFIPNFLSSTIIGSLIGWAVLVQLKKATKIEKQLAQTFK